MNTLKIFARSVLRFIQFVIYRLLVLAFEALYYPLAPFYDKISQYAFLGQWEKWQRSALPRLKGKRVLEVGCGTGSLLTEVLKRGYKAYGVDASQPMLNQAQKKLYRAGYSGRLLKARVQKLPFPDESFDTVVSTFPNQYILDVEALKEITRVLHPGGRLVIVDTAVLKPYNRFAMVLMWFYTNVLGYGRLASPEVAYRTRLPLSEAGLIRRGDETFEDQYGEAHIIIAIKVW
jgi:ubiquinone/menaquinone biosynthesis C-methylase UbiE